MPRTVEAGHSVTTRKPGPFFSRLSDRDLTVAVRIAGDKVKNQREIFEEWAAEEGVDPRRTRLESRITWSGNGFPGVAQAERLL
jgi:hypothetical protein